MQRNGSAATPNASAIREERKVAKQKVDAALGGQASGNNRYENRYTDATTGKGVGISKTDYSSPRSNNNQSGNLYAEAVAKNAESGAPWVSSGANAAATAAAGGLYGGLAGAGLLPKQDTAADATQPSGTTTPSGSSKPSGGGSGGSRVTYIDSNGDAQKGTTTAPTELQRSYLDDLKDQYQKMYDDAVKANNDAAKAAAERALAQVEQSVGELGDQYGNINKQLYRDYMESLRVLPQEMAARGYSGGMSESARLGLDTAYGERLNENEAARIAAIMQLRQQGADAEYQANAARDQANAQAQQNLYANMANLLLQQQQDAATRAQNMAQYGDFTGYLDLGYSQSQVDAMKKAWIAANPAMAQELGYVSAPRYSSYGGSGSGSNNQTGTVQQTVYDGIDSGMSRNEIWNALAADYKAGNITEEEFNNGIHYADYLEAAKSFGQTPSDAGYAKWRNGK